MRVVMKKHDLNFSFFSQFFERTAGFMTIFHRTKIIQLAEYFQQCLIKSLIEQIFFAIFAKSWWMFRKIFGLAVIFHFLNKFRNSVVLLKIRWQYIDSTWLALCCYFILKFYLTRIHLLHDRYSLGKLDGNFK